MAKLPPRSSVDPTTAKTALQFAPLLDDDEFVVHAGSAMHVQHSERFGRGTGEGQLALTNKRVIFFLDRQGPSGAWEYHFPELRRPSLGWIAVPMMKELKLKSAVGQGEISFYVGKIFGGLFVRDWDWKRANGSE